MLIIILIIICLVIILLAFCICIGYNHYLLKKPKTVNKQLITTSNNPSISIYETIEQTSIKMDQQEINEIISEDNRSNNSIPDQYPYQKLQITRKDSWISSSLLTALQFTLLYEILTTRLYIYDIKIFNIPVQFRKNCSSYVKIAIHFDKKKCLSKKTSYLENSLNSSFDDKLIFEGFTLEHLHLSKLHLAVFASSKKLKKILIGDIYLSLSRPDFLPNVKLQFYETISLACQKTKKCSSFIISGALGFLFIELEYEKDAERLRVFLRKGHNLPNHSKTLSLNLKPEFYAIINVFSKDELITYKETKFASGVNPIWNQAFLFYLNDLSNYWLQFLVMKGKFYTRYNVLGHVLIGYKTTINGSEHWGELLQCDHHNQVSRWHEIRSIEPNY